MRLSDDKPGRASPRRNLSLQLVSQIQYHLGEVEKIEQHLPNASFQVSVDRRHFFHLERLNHFDLSGLQLWWDGRFRRGRMISPTSRYASSQLVRTGLLYKRNHRNIMG